MKNGLGKKIGMHFFKQRDFLSLCQLTASTTLRHNDDNNNNNNGNDNDNDNDDNNNNDNGNDDHDAVVCS